MQIIEHRINTSEQLALVPRIHGVEIDLRSDQNGIYLSHDPFIKGENFEEWLVNYDHHLLVLNVKEDGLEEIILELLRKYSIDNYFFLDQPFPTQYKCSRNQIKLAYRFSDFEQPSINNIFDNMWIWVDSFSGTWDHLEAAAKLAKSNQMEICIVSPELQGRSDSSEILEIVRLIKKIGIVRASVCTKTPGNWDF
jgi:hypothetical protein